MSSSVKSATGSCGTHILHALLPPEKLGLVSFLQHLLDLLDLKTLGLRHQEVDGDEPEKREAREEEEGARRSQGLRQGEEGLAHDEVRAPVRHGSNPSTSSSVSKWVDLRVDDPRSSPHTRRVGNDVQAKEDHSKEPKAARAAVLKPCPVLPSAHALNVLGGSEAGSWVVLKPSNNRETPRENLNSETLKASIHIKFQKLSKYTI